MSVIRRRTALLGGAAMVFGLSGCSSAPPIDEDEVRDAVAGVAGVTSVDVRMREGGGVSGWKLEGRVGLPADEAEAHAVYEECLRALSTVPVKAGANFKIRLFGETSGKVIPPSVVGVPDTWSGLRDHFS